MFKELIQSFFKKQGQEVDFIETQEDGPVQLFKVGNKIMAAVLPDNLTDATETLEKIEKLENFEGFSDREYRRLEKLCWDLYYTEGAIFSTINAFAGLTITPIVYVNKEKDVLYFWLKDTTLGNSSLSNDITRSSLRSVLYDGFVSLLLSGNWVVSLLWRDVKFGESVYRLPLYFYTWDMQRITIKNTPGGLVAFYRPTAEEEEFLRKGLRKDSILNLYPKEYLQMLKKGYDKKNGLVLLDPQTTFIFRNSANPKNSYGAPYILSALRAVAEKQRLQLLDHAIISGLIYRVIIFKIGKLPDDKPYDQAALAIIKKRAQVFAQLWSSPKVLTNRMLLWGGDDVDVLDISSDGSILQFEGRFNEADDNITLALGIPRVLLDGRSTGTQARDLASFVTLRGRIDYWQSLFNSFLYQLFSQIYAYNEHLSNNFIPYLAASPIERTVDVVRLISRFYEDGVFGNIDILSILGKDVGDVYFRRQYENENEIDKEFDAPDVAFS